MKKLCQRQKESGYGKNSTKSEENQSAPDKINQDNKNQDRNNGNNRETVPAKQYEQSNQHQQHEQPIQQ